MCANSSDEEEAFEPEDAPRIVRKKVQGEGENSSSKMASHKTEGTETTAQQVSEGD